MTHQHQRGAAAITFKGTYTLLANNEYCRLNMKKNITKQTKEKKKMQETCSTLLTLFDSVSILSVIHKNKPPAGRHWNWRHIKHN